LRRITDALERDEYLADQIDEVDSLGSGLTTAVNALTSELSTTRVEMGTNANKVLWAALSASFALIAGIILVIGLG
jgi:hypothetical protein